MPVIPCPDKITCPGDRILSNYSSEGPDPAIFIRQPNDIINFIGGGGGGPVPVPDGAPPASQDSESNSFRCVNSPYSESFFFDGFQPITFDVIAGFIPSWINAIVSGETLILLGNPDRTDTGDFSFTILATDAFGFTGTKSFTISVMGITTDPLLPVFAQNVAYSVQLAAGGGVPPYEFSIISGSLPAGLTLSQDGLISGTPTAPTGPYPFQAGVRDSLARLCPVDMSFALNPCGGIPTGLSWDVSTFVPPSDATASGNFNQPTQTGNAACTSRSDFGLATSATVVFSTTAFANPKLDCNIRIDFSWNFVGSGIDAEMNIFAPFTSIHRSASNAGTYFTVVPAALFVNPQTVTFECETPNGGGVANANLTGTFKLSYV